MKTIKSVLYLSLLFIFPVIIVTVFNYSSKYKEAKLKDTTKYAIAIHGGAGFLSKNDLSAEVEFKYRKKLDSAITIGINILDKGGKSIDAVEKVINFLENDSMFNAGKGAVFTHNGNNELDASIMSGNDLNAGAVAGVSTIKNPISAARKVMENSKHVLLSGKGAEQFAKEQQLEIVNRNYFYTKHSFDRLQSVLKKDKNKVHGTVGCVALDSQGNLCAGTSTGGMTNKQYGRIGDSPIIGAGTYADNNTCAVSCTGHGEYFIRYVVAYDISALMKYKGYSLMQACNEVIKNKLVKAGGDGGVIAVDNKANIAMVFNTTAMFRASYKQDGKKKISIFPNE